MMQRLKNTIYINSELGLQLRKIRMLTWTGEKYQRVYLNLNQREYIKLRILGNIMYFLRKMAVSFYKTDKIAFIAYSGLNG